LAEIPGFDRIFIWPEAITIHSQLLWSRKENRFLKMRNFKERKRGNYSEQSILFLIPLWRFGLDCLVLFLIFWIVRNNPKGCTNSGFLYELGYKQPESHSDYSLKLLNFCSTHPNIIP
jgi:hypothetical protein